MPSYLIQTSFIITLSLLTACSTSTGNGSSNTATGASTAVSGSVGDGPIIGATVIVTDATGKEVARTTSDASAKYSVQVPSNAVLPLTIAFQGGTDLVTGKAPTVPVTTMVTDKLSVGGTITANGNPFSALIVDAAQKDAAARGVPVDATILNRARDRIVTGYNFGLDPYVDPIRTQVTVGNAAGIVKASEALAEAIRRSAFSLNSALTLSRTSNILNTPSKGQAIQTVIGVLSADVADGVIDGRAPTNINATPVRVTGTGAVAAGAAQATAGTSAPPTPLTTSDIQSVFLQMQSNTIKVLGEMLTNSLTITNPTSGFTEKDSNNQPITNATQKLDQATKTSTGGLFTGSTANQTAGAAQSAIIAQLAVAVNSSKMLLISSSGGLNTIQQLNTIEKKITAAAKGNAADIQALATTLADPAIQTALSQTTNASKTAAAVVFATNQQGPTAPPSAAALSTIAPNATTVLNSAAQATVIAANTSRKTMPQATNVPPTPAVVTQPGIPADVTPPAITPPANITAEANASTTLVALGNATVTDNSGATLFAFPDNPGPFPLGTTTVTWTAIDAAGNTATATQTVTITDTTPPAIANTATVTIEATGTQTTTPAFSVTASDALDPNPTLSNNAPATLPLGNTTITWTASDAAGNTATATQTITVQDTTAPTINPPAAITTAATAAQTSVTLGSATATDLVDPAPVITNNAPATFPVGTTTVTWTATDAAGNSATATQTVTLTDNTPPTITAPANVTASATGPQTSVSIGSATATDNTGTPTISNNAPASFPLGTTTVTWTATDASGNSATATQTVTVNDTTPPVVTPPSNLTINAPPAPSLTKTYQQIKTWLNNATATDAIDGTTTVTNNAPSSIPSGTTTVTWSSTDSHGNTGKATATITVSNPLRTDAAHAMVTTLSGDGNGNGTASQDGYRGKARFNNPQGAEFDANGNLFVAEYGASKIRKITPAGSSSTIASGSGLGGPSDVTIDTVGNLFVACYGDQTIKKITPNGTVSTLAGTANTSGATDGACATAKFNGPNGIAIDANGDLLVTDFTGGRLRRITLTPSCSVSTIMTGISVPNDIGVLSDGRIVLTAQQVVDIYTFGSNPGLTTLAGATTTMGFVDGTGSAARFKNPAFVAVNAADEIFIADRGNHRIRKVTTAGVVTTIAGTGAAGSLDGSASNATFNRPFSIAVDHYGNLAVVNSGTTMTNGDGQIRQVTFRHTIDAGVQLMGQALSFNGTNKQYAHIASDSALLTGTGSFTYEAWIKTSPATKLQMILQTGNEGSGTNKSVHLGAEINGTVSLITAFAGAGPKSTGTVNDGKWHHVAGVYNGTTAQVYIDGAASGATAAMSPSLSTGGTSGIGYFNNGTSNSLFFSGSIDEVKVWSTARTKEEVQYDMYARPDGTETGLAGYWAFDEPGNHFGASASTKAIDLTHNAGNASSAGDATLGNGTSNNSLAPTSVVSTIAKSFAPSTTINMRAGSPITIPLVADNNGSATTPSVSNITGTIDQFVSPYAPITPSGTVSDSSGRIKFTDGGVGGDGFDFSTSSGGTSSPTHTVTIKAR